MGMAIDRLQSGDARELDGPCSAAFVSSSAAVRTARHFVVRLRDGLAEMGDGSRSIDSFPPSASAIGSAKRGPGHDATPQQNRDSNRVVTFRSGEAGANGRFHESNDPPVC
jgi:hypothetical protein